MHNLNKPRFIISALLLITITMVFLIILKHHLYFLVQRRRAISEYLGWFIILTANGFLIFSTYLLFTKYKNIKLGGMDAKPTYTYTNWIAMLFSAGLGIGLLFMVSLNL
jgi:choline/glycine/proline betaine transport protein